MTTVLAYAVDGDVVMVADTSTNVYDRTVIGAARKIIRLDAGGRDVLIGISGSAGMHGRIRAAWAAAPPEAAPEELGDLQDWADDVASLLTRAMRESGLVDADGRMDGHFLMAAAGRVWTVYEHAAVRHDDGRAAVGSGEQAALGALAVLSTMGLAFGGAATEAVKVATTLDGWSNLPLHIEFLPAGR